MQQKSIFIYLNVNYKCKRQNLEFKMLPANHSNIPEEFCRIRTRQPRVREKIKYKKWLTANDTEPANTIHEEKIRELRELKRKMDVDIFKVKESALNYIATKRIKNLAQPKIYKKRVKEDIRENSNVKITALRYMPTQRILELAKPKESVVLTRPISL